MLVAGLSLVFADAAAAIAAVDVAVDAVAAVAAVAAVDAVAAVAAVAAVDVADFCRHVEILTNKLFVLDSKSFLLYKSFENRRRRLRFRD